MQLDKDDGNDLRNEATLKTRAQKIWAKQCREKGHEWNLNLDLFESIKEAEYPDGIPKLARHVSLSTPSRSNNEVDVIRRRCSDTRQSRFDQHFSGRIPLGRLVRERARPDLFSVVDSVVVRSSDHNEDTFEVDVNVLGPKVGEDPFECNVP